MKIVHCIWSFNTGGAETMLIDIANEQAKTQDVTVMIVNESYQQHLVEKLSPQVKVVFNHRKPNSRSLWPLVRLNWSLFRLQPDIIHIHNAMLLRAVLPHVSRGLFFTVHDLHISLRCVRRGTRLIAISDAVKADVLARGAYDVRTIPNGINVDAIARRNSQRGLIDGKLRIVNVGRLDAPKKGQDILINAIAELRQRGVDNVEVDFIGEGESDAMLHQLAEQLGISDRIHFLGLRDRGYIYSHLQDYDLMCHPARYEGFGLTVAEGMVAGLPALVSDEGGPYEVIDFGKAGYAFKMENVSDCADKIGYIMNHYDEALKIADIGARFANKRYSVQRMVAAYIEEYEKSIKR